MAARNPIVRTFPTGGWLDKPPVVSTGCQFVVIPKKGMPYALPVGVSPRGADFRSATMIYEVNVSADQFEIVDASVDSVQDAFGFQLTASVSYRVITPLKMVERTVTDTRADVRRLVIAAVNAVTRECDPDDIQSAQRAVRRKVDGDEGMTAQRLEANGYGLQDLEITLRRDKEAVTRERDRRNTRETRQDEVDHVAHVKQFIGGDIVTRMAWLATLGPEDRNRAIAELTEIEKKQIEMNMAVNVKILEAGLQDIPEQKRKKLFEDVRKQIGQSFTASSILQGSDAPALTDDSSLKEGATPSKTHDDEDDWDDED